MFATRTHYPPMNTKRILSRSVATLLALTPLLAPGAVDTLTGAGAATQPGVSWAPTTAAGGTVGVWSLGAGTVPSNVDNVVIAATGLVDIRGSAAIWPSHSTEIQDLAFNSTAAVTLNNNSSSQDMLLILNGGRGAGVPLISTAGNFAYTIQGPGSNATAHPLRLQLKASGEISVAANTLTISSEISESGGARSLSKTGAGVLILSGASSFTGGVTVSAGTLQVSNVTGLGTGAVVVNGAQLAVQNLTIANNVTLNGGTLATRSGDLGTFAGTVTVSGNSFIALKSYSTPANSQSITISGQLAGGGSLDLSGNNTGGNGGGNGGGKALVLTNVTNSYSGTFNVLANQILRSAPAVTGNTLGTGAVNLNGGTLQLRDDGTGSGATFNYNNNVTVAASGTIDVDHVGANLGNTFQLGTLNMAAGQTLTATGANSYIVRFGGATTLNAGTAFNPASAPLVLAGAVGGAGDLTMAGSGTLQLEAVNSYTGHTNVNAGTLTLLGSIASSPGIHVAAGATLDVTAAAGGFTLGGAQTLTGAGSVTGAATVGTGGTVRPGDGAGLGTLSLAALAFGTGAGHTAAVSFINNTAPALLNVTGLNGLAANGGANSVSVNLPGAAPAVGTYTLIDYAGAIGGTGFAAFKLGTVPNRLVASLVHNLGNTSIDLTVTGMDFPIWKGAQSTEWSTAAIAPAKNWVLNSNNATGTDYLANDSVTFNDLATTTTVNVSVADVTPASVVFGNVTKDYVITGTKAITGAGTFTVNGGGKVTVSNTNSFTSAPSLLAGIVSVAAVANGGVNSPLGAGTALVFGGGTLEYTGAGGSTDRAVTLGVSGGTVKTGTPLTMSGAVSGVGTLTKTGNGTLTITAANTYGDTVIAAGTLQVGAGGTTGTLGTGAVTNDGALIFDRSDAAPVVTGTIQGTGSVTKNGSGTVTLGGPGANSYAGLTTVSAGTLIAGKAVGVTAISGDLLIQAGGAFRYAGNNVSHQIADTASITLTGGTFGDTVAAGPTNPGATDTVANLTVAGGSFFTGRNATLAPFTVTGLLDITAGAVLAQRGGGLSAGTVHFSGGSLNLDGGSTTAGQESRLTVGAGGLVLTGATINLNAGPSAVTATSVGSIISLGGDLTSTGTSSFARQNPALSTAKVDLGGGTRTVSVTGILTIGSAGAPIEITNGALTKAGAGVLNLAGAQTYSTLQTASGVTNLDGALGTGTSTLDANATTNISVSQTLAALNIGAGATVTFGDGLAFAGEPEKLGAPALVPEPGALGLLLAGGLGLLGRRRR